jgi:hypothetical protein
MITTEDIKRMAGKALLSGSLGLVGLGLASGTSHAFNPQPEPPGKPIAVSVKPQFTSPGTPVSSTTQPPAVNAGPAPTATAAPATPAPCIGLPSCPTPPPDAEGNPACYFRDGWDADPSGSGINVYYFREPSNMSNPEQVTADVRMKDGNNASQIARIDPGQPVNQFQFPGIEKAAVQEVLVTSSTARCFVIGPSGS